MYYVTPARLAKSSFTTPFHSDGGLVVVVKEGDGRSAIDQLYLFLSPFDDDVWYAVMLMLILVPLPPPI
jgi:hypothetical protein